MFISRKGSIYDINYGYRSGPRKDISDTFLKKYYKNILFLKKYYKNFYTFGHLSA